MKKIVVTSALLLAASVASAQANQTNGFYVLPSIGQSKYDISKSDADDFVAAAFEDAGATVLDGVSSLDDKDTAWSLAFGWRFSTYLAAEVGYLDLGKAAYKAQGTVFVPGPGVLDATANLELSAKGPTLGLVGIVPIGENFDVHAKAGVFFAKTEIDVRATVDAARSSGNLDGNSKDLFYGVGAAYHFNDRIAVTLDYLLYKDVGDDEDTAEGDVDSLTVGVVFGF